MLSKLRQALEIKCELIHETVEPIPNGLSLNKIENKNRHIIELQHFLSLVHSTSKKLL